MSTTGELSESLNRQIQIVVTTAMTLDVAYVATLVPIQDPVELVAREFAYERAQVDLHVEVTRLNEVIETCRAGVKHECN